MKQIIAALLLAPSLCFADLLGKPVAVGAHTLTRHDPSHGANDLNFGAYVRTENNYLAGAYYNSHHRMAYYVGYTSDEYWRTRVSVVGVTGYFAPVTFVVIPSVRLYSFDNGSSLFVSGSPVKLTPDGQAILHLSLEWNL